MKRFGESDRPTDRPFFIIGAQRSGTTMLRLMLNAHPDIAVPFESGFIPEFFDRSGTFGDFSDTENVVAALDAIALNPFVKKGGLIEDVDRILNYQIESYGDLVSAIFSAYASARGKSRWGDKTPSYITQIDLLDRIFPDARFIHLVRDGRDVALSLRRVSWGERDLPRVATEWRWRTTIAHKTGVILRDRFLEIRYEDLVRRPGDTLTQVCAFLQEDFDVSMLEYHRDAKSQMPAESMQWHQSSVSAPERSKADRWRKEMSIADQVIFERNAWPALELFGYERVDHRLSLYLRAATRLKTVRYALYGG